MMVKHMFKGLLLVGAVALATGCEGDKSDPKTAGKGDLNPPGALWSVTQNNKIELRWTAGNVEEAFKGYYVFAVEKTKYDAKGAAAKVTFPTGVNILNSGIPRCVGNSGFFEAFGLPKTEADCEADEATPAAGAKAVSGMNALQEDPAAPAADKLTGFAKCDESTAAEPSLPKAAPQVEAQTCTISKLADGTALKNGTTYGFFVVSVMEEDLSAVSWTSNVIWDTPSADALPVAKQKIEGLDNGEMVLVALNLTAATADWTKVDCPAGDGPCGRISTVNAETPAGPTVYLSRAHATGAGSSLQRLYVSAPKGAATDATTIGIQPRGPQNWDPKKGDVSVSRIPGDEAAAEFPAGGTKYVVYNNQVFDFQVDKAGTKYYGKLVVHDVAYTGTDAAAAGTATLNVEVIMQPAAGVKHYFADPGVTLD